VSRWNGWKQHNLNPGTILLSFVTTKGNEDTRSLRFKRFFCEPSCPSWLNYRMRRDCGWDPLKSGSDQPFQAGSVLDEQSRAPQLGQVLFSKFAQNTRDRLA
jgi:hypothetical protein